MKQPISYHGGHSKKFCLHAWEVKIEEICKQRIKNGSKYFGFSEHIPTAFFSLSGQDFLYPEEKGFSKKYFLENFDLYVKSIKEHQKKYQKKAHILLGAETEMCGKNPCKIIQDLRCKYDFDYLVGSVHHVSNIPFDFNQNEYHKALQKSGSLEKLFLDYFTLQKKLIQKCQPEIIGHFDLIRIFAPFDFKPSQKIKNAAKENINLIIKYGGIFEVNSRPFFKGMKYPYPSAWIMEMIAQAGGLFTFGDDSHGKDDIFCFWDQAIDYLKNYTKNIVALRRIKTKKRNQKKPMDHLEIINFAI